jgi:hypothetical protein
VRRDQGFDTGLEGAHGQRAAGAEPGPQRLDVGARAGFVQRHADLAGREPAQVGAAGQRAGQHGVGLALDREGVEGVGRDDLQPKLLQAGRQDGGEARHPFGDALEPLRPVINRVHAGHHRRQHLGGADVGGGLLAADVLLACLQRQPVGGRPLRVLAHADQAAGHAALVLVAAGQVGGVRTAAAHRHAEALAVAHHDVGAELARRHQQGQRQQVGADDEGGLLGVRGVGMRLEVVDQAGGARVLTDHGEVVLVLGHQLRRHAHLDLQAERTAAGLDHLDGLRVAVAGHDQQIALALDRALGQRHRLGRRGGLVEHRAIGDGHAGEVADQGLEVQDRLHATLRDLGLVGRVGGVPGRVLEDVAQDDAGRVGVRVALADEALEHAVPGGDGAQLGQALGLADRRRQLHGGGAADARGHHGVHQRLPAGHADGRAHQGFIDGVRSDVAGLELRTVFKGGERRGHGGQSGRFTGTSAGRRRRCCSSSCRAQPAWRA